MDFNEHQNKIYIPNEIFNDLKHFHDKGSSHVAFIYSYYYLISWLYRYAKYGEMTIDVKMIKEMLGYNPNTQEINYIIKKNGILDQIGYAYTDTNYPISWEWNDGDIAFTMLNDMDDESKKYLQQQRGKNYKVKVPVKGLWRDKESREDNHWNGTFYEIDYTHEMTMDFFQRCVKDKGLGLSSFYLYGYLKYRCDHFGEYQCSLERLGEEVGMSKNTVDKYLTKLCEDGLISYNGGNCKKDDNRYKKEAYTYKLKV